jgi:hypothetical protein
MTQTGKVLVLILGPMVSLLLVGGTIAAVVNPRGSASEKVVMPVFLALFFIILGFPFLQQLRAAKANPIR